MTTTTVLKLTLAYQDYTTRTYSIKGYDVENIALTQERILAFNANVPSSVQYTFISDNNSPCANINDAQVITEESTIVYGAGLE